MIVKLPKVQHGLHLQINRNIPIIMYPHIQLMPMTMIWVIMTQTETFIMLILLSQFLPLLHILDNICHAEKYNLNSRSKRLMRNKKRYVSESLAYMTFPYFNWVLYTCYILLYAIKHDLKNNSGGRT